MPLEFSVAGILKLFKGHRRELFAALCLVMTVVLMSRGVDYGLSILIPGGFFIVYILFEICVLYYQYRMEELQIRRLEATKGRSAVTKAARTLRRRKP